MADDELGFRILWLGEAKPLVEGIGSSSVSNLLMFLAGP